MRFWWVNQNQTFDHEFSGGYIWSPKRRANNARNPFYEFMREVSPGDVVFSFNQTRIPAIAIAQSHCYEAPKPEEFGSTGDYWSDIGWRVDLQYFRTANPVRPADHMATLRELLPSRYSPLQQSGRGQQSVYLTELPEALAQALVSLLGRDVQDILAGNRVSESTVQLGRVPPTLQYEERLAARIEADEDIPETEKTAIVIARRGQGRFKENVRQIEDRCRITGVDKIEHLIASHCKPWRDCENNRERLDGENGLLLTPSIDHLFDRGFISFEGDGRLLVSPVAHRASLERMGVPTGSTKNVGSFTSGQRQYLEYHRDAVFLQSRIR